MKTNPLGRTGIRVTPVCLGTMTWGTQNTEAQAHEQMDYALDQGITFFDTAELYPTPPSAETQGRTERYIGSWLKARGARDKIVLASKVAGKGHRWFRGGGPFSGKDVLEALDGNLARLGTDYIDLYQLHWPNRAHYNFDHSWSFTPAGQDLDAIRDNMLDVLEALQTAQKQGKIRAVGVSNETSWGTMEYLRLAETHGLPRMASVQNEYNLLRRQHDLDFAEVSLFEDVGLLAYSPLAAGLVTGKYLDGAVPQGSRKDIGSMWRENEYSIAATRAYVALARERGLDPATLGLAFCLSRPFMTSVIIGATSMDQLRTNITARDTVLDQETLDAIEAIHRAHPRTI